jgi:hypothetical protein
MGAKLLILAFSCLLFATACDEKAPTGPTVPLNQQFTLAPGETATVQDTSLRVQFLGVMNDSRCPADVVCIQGGDALVTIRVMDGGRNEYQLHTGDESQASITHNGHRISLVQVQPYPFSSRTIRAEEYRATFTVAR